MYVSHKLATDPAVADVLTNTGTMVLNASGFGTLAFGVLIFVFALGKGAVSRFLCARPMVFLGEISFGMYLVHPLFLLYRGQAQEYSRGSPILRCMACIGLQALC
jgi:peptidoglycan/LPS O-acetylase OafA/YrhL